jgi:putative ABC transport system permease protein
MERVGTVQGISAMSPQLYVSTLRMPELSPVPVNIYGIDPETDFAVSPWLQKPLGSPLKPGEVIIGRDITGEVSTQITLGDRIYTIAGKLDPTQSPVDHTIFLPLDEAYSLATVKGIVPPSAPQISPGDVNAVLVEDAPGENQDIVGGRIKRFLASFPEYRYISVIGKHFSLDPVARDIQALPGVLNAISAFVVVITLPLIALIAAMVAHERQREIGILKAMGAKRNSIFFIVIAESLVLAATGGLAGVMVSYLALSVMEAQGMLNSALQVTFRMPAPVEIGAMAGLAFLVVITLGSISSLWPAYRSSMMNPYDAIRGEG